MRILLNKDEKVLIGISGSENLTVANINGKLLPYIDGEVAPDILESPDYMGFLHRHRKMEASIFLDTDHVVVDRQDWELVRRSWQIS
jgi:hypothetical protein